MESSPEISRKPSIQEVSRKPGYLNVLPSLHYYLLFIGLYRDFIGYSDCLRCTIASNLILNLGGSPSFVDPLSLQ